MGGGRGQAGRQVLLLSSRSSQDVVPVHQSQVWRTRGGEEQQQSHLQGHLKGTLHCYLQGTLCCSFDGRVKGLLCSRLEYYPAKSNIAGPTWPSKWSTTKALVVGNGVQQPAPGVFHQLRTAADAAKPSFHQAAQLLLLGCLDQVLPEIEGAFCNPTSTSSHLKHQADSFKTNIDYYRGKTKSIYEKEPIFRDFARNIPLSQSLDDSSSLHELKRDFQKLVSARDPVLGRPDPLKPSAGQNRLYQPKSEMLSARHKSQAPSPVILPYIYVYHRGTSRST